MNRKEAIEELKKYMGDNIKFYGQSTSGFFGEGSYYHQMFNEIIKVFEKPVTLVDFLGWEEGVEYDFEDLYVLKVENNTLFVESEECSSGWCNFAVFTDKLEDLRQAKKIEPKLKAYHVKDEYDFEALKEELIKRGYKKDDAWRLTLDNVPFVLEWVGKLEYVLEVDKNLVKFYTKYDFEEVADKYEIEEYRDERLFYAELKVPAGIKAHSWLKRLNYDPTVFCMVSWFELDKRDAKTKSEWNKLGINDTNADF